ncbi:MAG: hypothetical protein UIH27_04720 [Ruminococcus sp.]|nr:hypothetical protein [Ruminococcus sp.]
MKNVISELYYGNIDPQARGFKNGSFLKKQMAVLSESEAMLTEKLTGDEKKAFLSFVNASDVILGESELDSFIVGFRLGARLTFDTFVNDDTPYDDLLKEQSE